MYDFQKELQKMAHKTNGMKIAAMFSSRFLGSAMNVDFNHSVGSFPALYIF